MAGVLVLAMPVKNSAAVSNPQRTLTFKQTTARALQCDYLLSLPTGAVPASGRWPLILFLHGAGERGSEVKLVAKHGVAKLVDDPEKLSAAEREAGAFVKENFMVVSPQCPAGQDWDEATLWALLDEVMADQKVDKGRVYVAGLSMGGFAAWKLALHRPERFAAAVPVCGGVSYLDVLFTLREKKSSLSTLGIWAFHGGKDPVIPLEESQRAIDFLKKGDAVKDLKFTIFPEAKHDSWTQAFANVEVFRWLLAHQR